MHLCGFKVLEGVAAAAAAAGHVAAQEARLGGGGDPGGDNKGWLPWELKKCMASHSSGLVLMAQEVAECAHVHVRLYARP